MTTPGDGRSLEERIWDLEQLEAIRTLKYRYWRACDAKDPDAFRDCFIRSGASIRFGRMGDYDDAYVIEDGRWKKSKCHVRELWSVVRPLPEGTVITEDF